jgi:hypothetical protein
MTALAAATLLAWIPFVHPMPIPNSARLWMLFPLVACVAAVYRATRARDTHGMVRPTIVTFFNIVVGMALIAAVFYALHMLVRHFM